MGQEYWKWPESRWTSGEINWKKATVITGGVDIGTTSSQAVVLCDGEVFGYASLHTCPNVKATIKSVMTQAMGDSGMSLPDVGIIVGTGWGADIVPYAHKTADEVQCHAKGARFMFGPEVKTVVDMGGQTTKAMKLYDWDQVWDMIISDKCATGMGRNIELMSDLLHIHIADIGVYSLEVKQDPEPVSTTCYAFANPETIGNFRPEFRAERLNPNEVAASYIFAIAWRILGTIGKLQPLDIGDLSVYPELGFTGGLAKNLGITKRLERELNATALTSRYDPQLAGAIGAALLA